MNQILIILFLGVAPIFSLRWKPYPYADLEFEQKIAYDGYPLEEHKTTTEDNYILTIYRIPHGIKSTNKSKRSPVLLLHGMGASPDMFILQGANKSLAYSMAEGGFDVWLLNARGLRKSQGHKRYNLNKDKKYWDFGIHEVAVYDVAANIDYIINKTNQKPFLVGHSQGTTCQFMLLASKPEYNDKIKIGASYAPSVKVVLDNAIITPFVYISDVLKVVYEFLQFKELVPILNLHYIGKEICKEQTFFLELCFHLVTMIGTHTSRIIDKEMVPAIISTVHARISVIQILHFIQIAKTGNFANYDYGKKKNLEMYGNSTPPVYDLKKVTAPMVFFYAPKDDILTVKGVEEVITRFPNVYHKELVPFEYFNHIDFLFGSNTSDIVYHKTVKLFQDFDNKLMLK